MKNLTPEMIEKAKAAKSAEELLDLAKENNVEMTADEAKTYFAQLNPKSGELNDDDLDAVAGGASGCIADDDFIKDGTMVRVINGDKCPKCGGTVGAYLRGGYDHQPMVACVGCNRVITKKWEGDMELGVEVELV